MTDETIAQEKLHTTKNQLEQDKVKYERICFPSIEFLKCVLQKKYNCQVVFFFN